MRSPARRPGLPICAGALRPRHVLLVNPHYRKDTRGSAMKHALTPSLALTWIGAATPPGWSVRLWDENLHVGPPPADPLPQVVGITVHLTFARRAYALADRFRRLGSVVVLGGPHVSALPEEAAPHADAVVVGEGLSVWAEVLRDIATGRCRPLYRGDYRTPFRHAPPPRRDLLRSGSFLTSSSVIATRGCHNRCDFCYLATEGLRMPYQVRDVEDVVRDIKSGRDRYVVFLDNNLGSRPGYLLELCRALRRLGIIWSAAVSLDVVRDVSLVRAMALAGCTGVFLGLETIDGRNLTEAGKRTPAPEEYSAWVRVFHDHGIQVNGSFVLGFDHDRPDVFDRTIDWIEKNRLECATFQILTPYPRTPLYRRLEAEGRILTRRWDLYDTCHAVFEPKHMSPGELEAGYARCYRKLFTLGSIWRRRPVEARAALPYFAMSILYKRMNRVWPALVGRGAVSAFWRPLVGVSRLRHLAFRTRLAAGPARVAGRISPMRTGSKVERAG